MKKEVGEDIFQGIDIGSNIKASHSLFFDNILIFGMLQRNCWIVFYENFQDFCVATSMQISEGKS